MKKQLLLPAVCLFISLTQAAPFLPDQLRLRATMQPSADLGISGNSIFNARFYDGKVYVNQINTPCFGRYAEGSSAPEILVNNAANNTLEHRMVAPFRGSLNRTYLIASSSAAASTTTFTRYNYDGSNPVTAPSPDAMIVDAFDWVDDDTLINAVYTSGSRKRLYLVDVTADPFSVSRNTSWNGNGYVTTSVSTRIRNIRKGDVFSGYAYYGDGGQNTNPNFYALNLATGAETPLGNAGTLTGTGSFGVWTVLERGGYLYVQTTDNGIQIYSMVNATTLGSLYATLTKPQLDTLAGGGSAQYWGFDLTPDGRKLLLSGGSGKAFQLDSPSVPYLGQELQLREFVQPSRDLNIAGNSMFNPRYFDGKIYANQINPACFGRYPSGSTVPEMLVNNSATPALEHRMVAPFRGSYRTNFLLGSSSAAAATVTFTRYDFDGNNPFSIDSPDSMTVDAFDWVDEDTVIYAVYSSGHRKELYLADVYADPFFIIKNLAWNANGFVTSSVTTRIRNVRKGDVYSGYAYYGDAGLNSNPKFYALDLTNGVETLLGSLGTLTGSGSFGLWTVLERDGYLYVQTTDNGIQVYAMSNATTLGPLYATYTKAQLDTLTAGSAQYYGLDVSTDGRTLLLGGLEGKVFEFNGRPILTAAPSGTNLVLSWPAWAGAPAIEVSTNLSQGFRELAPRPAVLPNGNLNTATVPIPPSPSQSFFRLRQ